jgi:hypothetical protein
MGLSASIRPSPWHVSHRICPLRIESAIVVAQYRFGNVFDQKFQAMLTEGRDGNNGAAVEQRRWPQLAPQRAVQKNSTILEFHVLFYCVLDFPQYFDCKHGFRCARDGVDFAMTDLRLKNIDRFIDRHGKPRHYYRAGKGARVALPGQPGSPEFMLAYEMAARDDRSGGDKLSFDRKEDGSICASRHSKTGEPTPSRERSEWRR